MGGLGGSRQRGHQNCPCPVVWVAPQVPNVTSVGVTCGLWLAWALLVHRQWFSQWSQVSDPSPGRKEGGDAREKAAREWTMEDTRREWTMEAFGQGADAMTPGGHGATATGPLR